MGSLTGMSFDQLRDMSIQDYSSESLDSPSSNFIVFMPQIETEPYPSSYWRNRMISVCLADMHTRKIDVAQSEIIDRFCYVPAPAGYLIGNGLFSLGNVLKARESNNMFPDNGVLKQADYLAVVGIVFLVVAFVFSFPAVYRLFTTLTHVNREKIKVAKELVAELRGSDRFSRAFFEYLVEKEGSEENAMKISYDKLTAWYLHYKA